MRTLIATLALAAAAILGQAPASAETTFEAPDTPGCWTFAEMWTAPYPATRRDLERYAGVRPRQGEYLGTDGHLAVVRYLECGPRDADLTDDLSRRVEVTYNIRTGATVLLEWY